jgi:hypothetical protein
MNSKQDYTELREEKEREEMELGWATTQTNMLDSVGP